MTAHTCAWGSGSRVFVAINVLTRQGKVSDAPVLVLERGRVVPKLLAELPFMNLIAAPGA